jgi:hypothetical protein
MGDKGKKDKEKSQKHKAEKQQQKKTSLISNPKEPPDR